ncbi:MAG: hypothetical protein AMQ22_00570 [Candidatus Methanofastidiosum methylothiophilum]|uniref:Uncharacterized protein n=1 Tax=Candidatus Methanofastidiosum methylothiophilum TaxID=1705564 RepID=A0A150J6A0_9EURY|nr:MAG: hypothetical protein AMQ22_00570 [Candidatus Methanofastidiosum methylthiophilus]
MCLSEKFLWTEGDLILHTDVYGITEKEYKKADKSLDEVIKSLNDSIYHPQI